jgi:hypothetical protein
MDDAESRITAGPQYLRVDFGSCDRLELSATYRSFADLCLGKRVKRALLQAGDNEPEGHNQLREALVAMARAVAIPPDFKLALVASTPPATSRGWSTAPELFFAHAASAVCEANSRSDSRLTTA